MRSLSGIYREAKRMFTGYCLSGEENFLFYVGYRIPDACGTPPVSFSRLDERLLYIVGMWTEHLSEEIFMDIRPQELFTEGAVRNFLSLRGSWARAGTNWPSNPCTAFIGYFPDAEESQNVVDAVSVEVFGHLFGNASSTSYNRRCSITSQL